MRPIWADDEGNYAAIHVIEPLLGYVCFLDFNDLDTSPQYSSVERFLNEVDVVHRAQGNWWDMRSEYPAAMPSERDPIDLAAVGRLLSLSEVAADLRLSCQLSLSALSILPPGNVETVHELMRSENLWVRERACTVAGVQKIDAVVPELLAIASHSEHPNDRIAAVLALQKIPGDEAASAVVRLRSVLGPAWQPYFRKPSAELIG